MGPGRADWCLTHPCESSGVKTDTFTVCTPSLCPSSEERDSGEGQEGGQVSSKGVTKPVPP